MPHLMDVDDIGQRRSH